MSVTEVILHVRHKKHTKIYRS